MATAKVRVRLNETNILLLGERTSERLARNGAERVKDRAQRNAPVRTGALRDSIGITKIREGLTTTYKIGSPLEYAQYQEDGTGPVIARPGGVLVFEAGGVTVFAKHTRGTPATHFMRRTAATITEADFRD